MSAGSRSCLLAAVIVALSGLAVRAQPQQAQACPQPDGEDAIVCAISRYGQKQTYWNACLATQDGAYAMEPGECPHKGGNFG